MNRAKSIVPNFSVERFSVYTNNRSSFWRFLFSLTAPHTITAQGVEFVDEIRLAHLQ